MTFEEIVKREMDKMRPELNRLLLKHTTRTIWFERANKQVRSKVNYEDIELPRYKCHKEVKAVKLSRIEYHENPIKAFLVPEDKKYNKIEVSFEWIAKHTPTGEGYFVCYKDGYESYSPAAPFEEGYSLVEEPSE